MSHSRKQAVYQNSTLRKWMYKKGTQKRTQGQTCSRSPSSDPDNRQSHPVKANNCRNRHPTPNQYRHNTCNTRYESESETEEPYTPRYLHIGSIDTNTLTQPHTMRNLNQILILMMNSHNQIQIQSEAQYPSLRINILSWTISALQCPHSVQHETWKIQSVPLQYYAHNAQRHALHHFQEHQWS